MKKVFIACDHGGFVLKELFKTQIQELGFEVIDLGTDDETRSADYNDFADKLTQKLTECGRAQTLCATPEAFGVLICGSGIGMSMAANRVGGIRAALCHDVTTAWLARKHNNANVLCLGGRIVSQAVASDIVQAFFTQDFEGGRHERRVSKLG